MTTIFCAVLRVSGEELDPEAFLARFPRHQWLAPDAVWHRGEQRRPRSRGELHKTSGFNLDLGEDIEWKVVEERLALLSDLLEAAVAERLEVIVDLGILAGRDWAYVPTLYLGPSDLARLSGLGVVLAVTSYPWSRTEDDDAGAP